MVGLNLEAGLKDPTVSFTALGSSPLGEFGRTLASSAGGATLAVAAPAAACVTVLPAAALAALVAASGRPLSCAAVNGCTQLVAKGLSPHSRFGAALAFSRSGGLLVGAPLHSGPDPVLVEDDRARGAVQWYARPGGSPSPAWTLVGARGLGRFGTAVQLLGTSNASCAVSSPYAGTDADAPSVGAVDVVPPW